MQKRYHVKYYYQKQAGSGKNSASFEVRADNQIVALELAKIQAAGKHPGCNVVILELKEK